MAVPKSINHIKFKIKMQTLSQEPPASSKVTNGNLMDIDVLCTLKSKIESKFFIKGVSKTSDPIQNKIKMPNPSQEPPAPTNQDLKDMDILCTFKMKIESQNLEFGLYQRPVTISKLGSRCKTPVRNLQPPSKSQIRT